MHADIELRSVCVAFSRGRARPVLVLDSLTLSVSAASSLALLGPSGSGKSTVLNLISGIVRPTSGEVIVGGEVVSSLSPDHAADFRRRRIGFVFQSFHLLPHLSAAENVLVATSLAGTWDPHEARERAQKALDDVGLSHRANHKPAELSGGEQQRVAIARVLARAPDLILADEPTGNLDPSAAATTIALLLAVREATGATLVMATHDATVAAIAETTLHLDSPAGLLRHLGARSAPSAAFPSETVRR